MNQNEITPDEDIKRLIGILNTKTKNGQRQFTIYSCYDKWRPAHSLVYYDPDTVLELKRKSVIRIDNTSNNPDEDAPGLAGPPYYVVTVLEENPFPLPEGVNVIESPTQYILRFSDGKELDFTDISTDSAKYFKLLVDKHGLDVRHEIAKQVLGKSKTTKQIHGLVGSINDKAKRKTISNRICIDSEYKGAYKLLVTFTPKNK